MTRLCLSVNYSFQCGFVFFFFLFAQSVGATQLVSKFLLEGIVPYVAIGSACLWEEMNSGAYV